MLPGEAARLHEGNGAPSREFFPGMDSRMDALLERMDRLACAAEKSSVTIYQRRLNMTDFANPAPIGLYAFAIATALYMTSQAHITEQSAKFISFPIGMFLGGLTMLVTGFLELYRHNSLGATAFCTYGAFWIAVGVYGTIKAAGIYFLDSPKGEQALTALMAIASITFAVVSLALNRILPLLFIMLTIMFCLLSAGVTHPTTAKVAGWWGVVTSAMAFYAGTATLIRDMWGRDILPQGFTAPFLAVEKIILPRVEVPGHDVEAGKTPRVRTARAE